MTHDTREVSNWKEQVRDWWYSAQDYLTIKGAELNEARRVDLEHIIDHQLQKARHDWLREEIVRLEGMKNIVGSQTEISSNESLVKMVKNVIELKGEMAYNQALQTIIDRYHSELDQPTRDDWNEDMEHSHGLNELDQDKK